MSKESSVTEEVTEPTQVEEVNPIEQIESLERDLVSARRALLKIMGLRASLVPGDGLKKNKFMLTLRKAQDLAIDAYYGMENWPDE